MPIQKDNNGKINYTAPADKKQADETDVHLEQDFAVCDTSDRLKQIRFDPTAQDTNSVTVIASQTNTQGIINLPNASNVTIASTADIIAQQLTGVTPVTVDNATHTVSLTYTPENVANKGQPSGYPSLDSSGLVPLTQLPPAALERLIIVANQTARYALTTAQAQNGDTVKEVDTGLMWYVKDDTNLGNSNGYAEYTAGAASSVPWSGVSGTPTTVSGYGITDGEVTTNKDSNTSLGTSNVKYPTQGAVKSYVDTGLSTKQNTIAYTPEDVANKSTSTSLGVSDTLYPSQAAVKSYVDTGLGTKQNSLGFTPENVANKSTATDLGGATPSDTLYPSQKATKTYTDTAVATKPALSSTAATDIATSSTIGVGTTAARADHTHKGVLSVSKNGSTALNGSVTLSAGTNIALTQSGQDISIAANANVSSIAKSGSTALTGDVTLTGSTGVTLTQVGNNIDVGAAFTNWTTYTMVITATSVNPTKGSPTIDVAKWRRVGDSIEIMYNLKTDGTGTQGTGTYLFSLPSLTADTTKLAVSTVGLSIVGEAAFGTANPMENIGPVVLYDSTHLACFGRGAGASTGFLASNYGWAFNGVSYLSFRATIPISGYGL